ncbi:MAG: histone deacetylase family protein [Bauldia sp.]|mgnify:CR=1 FL=1
MTTLYVTHPAFLNHQVPSGHPERPDRLRAIEAALAAPEFADLKRAEAPLASEEAITAVHDKEYLAAIRALAPLSGLVRIDADTSMSPGTFEAALRAAGAATAAVDQVMTGKATNAFCAVRPPGHHAEPARAMGFCFFNNAAIAARHATRMHGAERVAIVDWDVHHGNGTQAAFWNDPSTLYASTHQMPLYPGTGGPGEVGVGNILNIPLAPGTGSAEFRAALADRILPAIDRFAPHFILISAGFDAHTDDPLASLNFVDEDYGWATQRLVEIADRHTSGRIVSVLEGGYDLRALAGSVALHVAALMAARPRG